MINRFNICWLILYYGDEVGTTIVSYIDLTAISIKQCDIIIRRVFISVYMNRYSVAKILKHIFCCQCTANFPAFLRFRDNFISIHIVFACNHKACFRSADYIVYIPRVCIMKCFLRSRKGNKCVFKRNQVQQADSYWNSYKCCNTTFTLIYCFSIFNKNKENNSNYEQIGRASCRERVSTFV